MSYKIKEEILPHLANARSKEEQVDAYLKEYRTYLLRDYEREAFKEMCSGFNRMKRRNFWCCEGLDLCVEVGDIVYMEFGQAFLNEAGFQHFGLVMQLWNRKALVVPMTSNQKSYETAINVSDKGRSHLYYIGYVKGLSNHSTLFLNDIKMLNTSRIISINGSICPQSVMFKEIKQHLMKALFETVIK